MGTRQIEVSRAAIRSATTARPAPKLQFAELLQAPSGTRVDWSSLKGKTVVLEFWATWCGPCVQSIPHLNALAAAVDPNKVVFISIDDEDLVTIGTFISKRKMAGWVGVDPTKTVFKAYGVRERPATIVIDGSGRVAAVTTPEQLTAPSLMALASSRSAAKLPVSSKIHAVVDPKTEPAAFKAFIPETASDKQEPLFEISVRPSAHNGGNQFMMKHDHSGNYWWYGVDETFLLLQAYNLPLRRFTFTGPKIESDYDFALKLDGLDRTVAAPVIQAAVRQSLNLDVVENDMTQDALVMRPTHDTMKRLQPTASTATPPSAGLQSGRFVAVNSSLDEIAAALEECTGIPVINETHLSGTFDADFPLPSKDPAAVEKDVLKMLGIELTQEPRRVATFVVSQHRQEDKH